MVTRKFDGDKHEDEHQYNEAFGEIAKNLLKVSGMDANGCLQPQAEKVVFTSIPLRVLLFSLSKAIEMKIEAKQFSAASKGNFKDQWACGTSVVNDAINLWLMSGNILLPNFAEGFIAVMLKLAQKHVSLEIIKHMIDSL